MSVLKVVAQNVMDLYYQQYKSEEDFFKLYHFKYLVSISYAAYLQNEYEKSYKMNLAETGVGEATLSPEWFINNNIEVKRSDDKISPFVGELPCKPFHFKFDKQSSGIKDVLPLNGRCGDFIRMNSDEKYKFELIPASPEIFWFPLGNKIHFSNISCGLSSALVIYIPSMQDLDDNAIVPEGIELDVLSATLNLMFNAKKGTPVIDVTQDDNPNKALQTEINNLFSKMGGQ